MQLNWATKVRSKKYTHTPQFNKLTPTVRDKNRKLIANPDDKGTYAHVERGQELFGTIGCAVCHKPYLELHDPVYTEPNPYNPQEPRISRACLAYTA